MGAPEQMKDLEFLVGIWDVDMKFKMEENATDWTETKGVATYSMDMNGCALRMVYESDFMGHDYVGQMVQCFDRETNKWQSIWVDNMAARISLYDGEKKGDSTIMTGEDIYKGQKFISRISSYNETPDSFDWKMEHSLDGGKTFMTSGMAHYVKRK